MTTAEEVDPPDEPRTYRKATFPRRFAVGVAGSTMHFVMAYLLLFALYAAIGPFIATGTQVGGLYNFTHGRTPAQIAGLKAGDVIVSVNGKPVVDPSTFEAVTGSHSGVPVQLVVRRGGHLLDLVVTPVDGRHVSSDVSG